MDIITGKILKLNDWPDGKIIGITKRIGMQLVNRDLTAKLSWRASRQYAKTQVHFWETRSWLIWLVSASALHKRILHQMRYRARNRSNIRSGERKTLTRAPSRKWITPCVCPSVWRARLCQMLMSRLWPSHRRCPGDGERRHPICGRCRYCMSDEVIAIRSVSSPVRTKEGSVQAGTHKADLFRYGRTMERL